MLEEPCEATSLTHGFEAERRGRPLRLGNHFDILNQGVETWNIWREQHKTIHINLSEINLSGKKLSGANLSDAHLHKTDLSGAYLYKTDLSDANLYEGNLSRAQLLEADLSGAQLSKANLSKAQLLEADLSDANLSEAILSEANLSRTGLTRANLSGAEITGANLSRAILVETILTKATLTGCLVYGIAAWDVQLEEAKQDNLVITLPEQPIITVDNLKIAQFIYLLLNNKDIREVIDTITSKVVLILGRFTPERKAILDTLRDELRKHNYSPVLFDFEKPRGRNFTETIRTLAHLSRFIIADLTDPSSIPQELQAIIPTLAVPVQPVLLEGKREYAIFVDFLSTYPWVLPIHYYIDQANLLATLKEDVIEPAEQKAQQLEKR
jgi:hypothetical protein